MEHYHGGLSGVEVVSTTPVANTIVNDLYDEATLYLRLDEITAADDVAVRNGVAAAIDAAEGYLGKSILPQECELLWHSGGLHLEGAVRSLKVETTGSPAEDVTSGLTRRGSGQIQGGLRLYRGCDTASWANWPYRVTYTTGCLKVADIPAGIKAFIFAFVGMLYENRELANLGANKYTLAEFPTYLLDPLKSPTVV